MEEFMLKAWEFLNAPLPIIGVSLIIVLCFVIKIISMTSFGKKNNKKLNEKADAIKIRIDQYENMVETHNEKMEHQNSIIKEQNEKIIYLEGKIVELCKLIPNKKVKQFGEELEHEETINSTPNEE